MIDWLIGFFNAMVFVLGGKRLVSVGKMVFIVNQAEALGME